MAAPADEPRQLRLALMLAEPGEALSSYEKRVAFMEILKAKPGYWLAGLFFKKQNVCTFLNKFEQIGSPPFPHPAFTSRRVWNAEIRAIQCLIRHSLIRHSLPSVPDSATHK